MNIKINISELFTIFKMLFAFPLDIYSVIVKYITPVEFQKLYVACNNNNNIIQEYLKQHCSIECEMIISDEFTIYS